jgi:hypothetical protein
MNASYMEDTSYDMDMFQQRRNQIGQFIDPVIGARFMTLLGNFVSMSGNPCKDVQASCDLQRLQTSEW